jgi:spermidine/putrescine transport system permease protein
MRRGGMAVSLYALLVFAFIYLPVAVLGLYSLQGSQIPVPPFNGPSLKWYGQVLSNAKITDALWNSIAVAVLSSAVSVLLAFLAAYGLARHAPRASGLFKGLLLAPLAVSYLIIGMGLLIAFNAVGIRPSLAATGIGHVVINMPLCFAIIFSQLGDHHLSAEKAARDLGARSWQVLLLITAPMLWPALFASFFLSFTLSWDEFIIAFLLTRFETTLPVEIWNILRSGLSPRANAVGTLVFIVSIVLIAVAELVLMRKGSHGAAR